MNEKVIGLIWRFKKNDYQISLMDYDKNDQKVLMALMDKYSEKCSCERGDENLAIKAANIEYWEEEWAEADMEQRRKDLAKKLFSIGLLETDTLYDHQADEQLTEEQLADVLKDIKSTSYMLETFMQLCDGSQEEEDHKKFLEASMAIVHYLESLN